MLDKPKDVPRLDWRTLFKAEKVSDEHRQIFDEYFSHFAQPPYTVTEDGLNDIGMNPCLKCGKPLQGNLIEQLIGEGGFTWGITHGEGYCRKCGWPARAYHFIKDKDGKEITVIRGVILQYHPDEVEIRERKEGIR